MLSLCVPGTAEGLPWPVFLCRKRAPSGMSSIQLCTSVLTTRRQAAWAGFLVLLFISYVSVIRHLTPLNPGFFVKWEELPQPSPKTSNLKWTALAAAILLTYQKGQVLISWAHGGLLEDNQALSLLTEPKLGHSAVN